MRIILLLSAVVVAGAALAQPTDLGTTVPWAAPKVFFTRSAGVQAYREMPVELARGENHLLLEVASLGPTRRPCGCASWNRRIRPA